VLRQHFDYVAGSVEMQVRASWAGSLASRCPANRNPEQQEAETRDNRVRQTYDRLQCPRIPPRQLAQQQEICRRNLETALAGYCREMKCAPGRTGQEIATFACLIERVTHGRFEAAVRKAARRLDPGFVLECTGPWAPRRFATVGCDFLQDPARILRPIPEPRLSPCING